MTNKEHYIGHRQRLKTRLIDGFANSFADYELLEILLFYAIPRRDVKPLAKQILAEFGDIANLINCNEEKLFTIEGMNSNIYILLLVIQEIINRKLKDKIIQQNIINSWAALLDYLKFALGDLKIEQFRVLFLNKRNVLISDEVMSSGTIDQTAVYPREIIKRALFHEAGAIILVHNHPSGNSKPSKMDVELTNKLAQACSTFNITIHDHVIISRNEYYSFKSNMLL